MSGVRLRDGANGASIAGIPGGRAENLQAGVIQRRSRGRRELEKVHLLDHKEVGLVVPSAGLQTKKIRGCS